MITNNGKNIALRYLAGLQPSLVSEIAVGIGNSTEAATDTRLNFEVGRFPVIASTISGTAEEVVFQGSVPVNDEYKIYEIGIFPKQSTISGNPVSGVLLSTFSPGDGTSFNGVSSGFTGITDPSVSDFRIGNTGARVAANYEYSSTPINGDYSRFNIADYVTCAFITETNSFDFTVELWDTSNGSTSVTFNETGITNGVTSLDNGTMMVASATGPTKYVICSIQLSSITSNFANLSHMKVVNNSSTYWIKMDGIRMDDGDSINPLNSMVARTVPATVREKTAGFTVDVEYRLTVNF